MLIYFDLEQHLDAQKEFSEKTFGPGLRTAPITDHIRKELKEIEKSPTDLLEWIDVVILALDGAWRTGATAEDIATALMFKQRQNERRTWPRWEDSDPSKAIEHVKSENGG